MCSSLHWGEAGVLRTQSHKATLNLLQRKSSRFSWWHKSQTPCWAKTSCLCTKRVTCSTVVSFPSCPSSLGTFGLDVRPAKTTSLSQPTLLTLGRQESLPRQDSHYCYFKNVKWLNFLKSSKDLASCFATAEYFISEGHYQVVDLRTWSGPMNLGVNEVNHGFVWKSTWKVSRHLFPPTFKMMKIPLLRSFLQKTPHLVLAFEITWYFPVFLYPISQHLSQRCKKGDTTRRPVSTPWPLDLNSLSAQQWEVFEGNVSGHLRSLFSAFPTFVFLLRIKCEVKSQTSKEPLIPVPQTRRPSNGSECHQS